MIFKKVCLSVEIPTMCVSCSVYNILLIKYEFQESRDFPVVCFVQMYSQGLDQCLATVDVE